MSENNRFIDMWWLVAEIGSADTMLPFYLQKWPSSWILTINIHCRENLIIGPNSACKATSLSMVWWMSIQFCVREKVCKRDISVSFTKRPPSWILTINIPCREKNWSFDWIQHAKLHLCPSFGEYIPNFMLDIDKIRNLWKNSNLRGRGRKYQYKCVHNR